MKRLYDRARAGLAKSWRWLVLAGALLLAAIGVTRSIRARNEARLDAAARGRVRKHASAIAVLREQREQVNGRLEERAKQEAHIEAQIAASQRAIVETYTDHKEMTDDEVFARFRDLGYR